jgi:hypothetical protein
MADLYPPSYTNRQHQTYHRHADPISSQQQQSYSQMGYASQPAGHSGSSNDSSEDVQESTTAKLQDSQPVQKSESKPQATFLTKLYAYVLFFALFCKIKGKLTRWWHWRQSPRTSGKSSYDSLGPCGRTYHC